MVPAAAATGAMLLGPAQAQPPVPEGFTRASNLFRGTEAMLIGLEGGIPGIGVDLPAGFTMLDMALAGDGTVVWFVMVDPFAPTVDDRYLIGSVFVNGANPEFNVANLPEGTFRVEVLASEDGLVGVLDVGYDRDPRLPIVAEHRFLRTVRGEQFGIAFDTVDAVDRPECSLGPFGVGSIQPRLSDDGERLLFTDGDFIWQQPLNPGLNPFCIAAAEDVRWNDEPPTASGFRLLDTTASGGEWITTLEFAGEPFANPQMVLTGMSIPVTSVENVIDGTWNDTPVQIDDFGEQVAYCQNDMTGAQQCWAGEQGGVQRMLGVEVGKIQSLHLNDNGGVLYMPVQDPFGTIGGFYEMVESGARVQATADYFYVAPTMDVQLSDDASVLMAFGPASTFGPIISGIVVHIPNGPPIFGSPTIEDVFYRYTEGGSLRIRTRIRPPGPGGLSTIQVTPIKDRYIEPTALLSSSENPFLNFSAGEFFAPVAGEPDTWEATVFLRGLEDLIDGSFTLRLYAVNSAGNQVAYVDFYPAPSGAPTPPAANDACLTAIPAVGNGVFLDERDTGAATADTADPSPSCGQGADGATVWYVLTPSAASDVEVSTVGSDYDTVLSVWRGDEGCGALVTEVACDDDGGGGGASELVFPAEPGTTYLVQVGSKASGEGGSLRVRVVPELGGALSAAAALAALAALRRYRRARCRARSSTLRSATSHSLSSKSGPLRRFALVLVGFGMLVAGGAQAIQPDGPFVEAQKKNAQAWAGEDAQIDRKLEALRQRFGKRPNIIYILADDVGWGELGWQGGGKHRGTPTPELDRMAAEGMRFWSAYAEPSCTPSRIAINTGRHPVRTGLLSVLWPGQTEGLSPQEVTVAEVLSEAGYHTAMWGKWHLGELPEQAPENQGYDYAYYGLFNGAPDAWPGSAALFDEPTPFKGPFYDFPGIQKYKEMTGIDLSVAGYVGHKGKGRRPIEGPAGKLSVKRQDAFEKESIGQILGYVEEKAKSDRPFFIYWATYTQQITGAQDHQNAPHVDRANAQASMMAQHNTYVRALLDKLSEEGIAENTLVVWWSDNGPMYAFWPTAGYSWLKGSKGDVSEGGVRVPAMAWWPGMIEPNQDPVDMVHLVDLYTTAARIGGAVKRVPNDRVTDGIDQTALLLLGEGHSRRNYMFHYSGGQIGALRYEDFKIHILPGGHGGLPNMEFYNVRRDPGEKRGEFYPGLFVVTPLQRHLRSHMMTIRRFPHRVSETVPKGAEVTAHD